MTELERFELCRTLPRHSCGTLIRIPSNIAQAYLADIEGLFRLLPGMRQQYESTQWNYAALPPNVRAIADVLLPWMLYLRLRYGPECSAMMVRCYPKMSGQSHQAGLRQPN